VRERVGVRDIQRKCRWKVGGEECNGWAGERCDGTVRCKSIIYGHSDMRRMVATKPRRRTKQQAKVICERNEEANKHAP
jgi:hypothetical protein